MRPRTALVVAVVLVGLVGAAVVGLTDTGDPTGRSADNGTLSEQWVSTPPAVLESNHHTPAAAFVDGESFVVVPINSRRGTTCRLTTLDGNGTERWNRTIAAEECTIHSISDPTIADFDGDGETEVIAATSAEEVVAYDLRNGSVEFRRDLSSYGYSKPLVGDLLPGAGNETVVVDLGGGVFTFAGDGSIAWQRSFGDARVRQPVIADVDGDGDPEIAIGQLGGEAIVLERDGSVAWRQAIPNASATKWMTTGQADDDAPLELTFATFFGEVVTLDGANGSVEWRRNFSAQGASVRAMGDGDGDGRTEVYVVARDGVLRSLDAANGSLDWRTRLTAETDARVMPPPSLGDLDGDGDPELVAVTAAGRVLVIDPADGETVDSYERDVPINTFPRVADFDGDGDDEIFVIYDDARVVALSYDS